MRRWIYLIIVVMLVVGAFFAGGVFFWRNRDVPLTTSSFETRGGRLEEKEGEIQRLENQIVELRKELEESSRRVGELRARVEDTTKALSLTEQKLRSAMRQPDRAKTGQAEIREKAIAKPAEPSSLPPWRRPAEPGTYETIRDTSVFEEPSGFSRKVSKISKGTRVTVVRSLGEWLEVRSKHGNPPGFVRRDDAMFLEKVD